MDDTCLILLHLPKTGGTTVTTVIRWQYRRLDPAEFLEFYANGKDFEEFSAIPYAKRAGARVLVGHFAYGVHEYIPRPCRYVTIIREPVERVVSAYRYTLSTPTAPLHGELTGSAMSLDEYLHRHQAVNALTRAAAGRDEAGEVTEDDLEAAKRNLEGFVAVGLTEHFDASLMLFKRLLDWGMPFYFSRNVSSKGPRPADVSKETREYIRECNALDIELYAYARTLFISRVRDQGTGFEREVQRFRQLNRIPQGLRRIAEPMAPKVRRLLEWRASRSHRVPE